MRQIPLSRRSHITGFQTVGSCFVQHESALERDFVTLSQFLSPNATITSQPVTVPFDAEDGRRRYTPDFRLDDEAGRFELVEVKYRLDLLEGWGRLRPGFVAARNWARERGGTFRIATERGIRGALLDNAKRLLPLRRIPVDVTLGATVLDIARSRLNCSFRELAAALPFERAVSLSLIWRMIAHGHLKADATHSITSDSVLWVAP